MMQHMWYGEKVYEMEGYDLMRRMHKVKEGSV